MSDISDRMSDASDYISDVNDCLSDDNDCSSDASDCLSSSLESKFIDYDLASGFKTKSPEPYGTGLFAFVFVINGYNSLIE